MKTLFRMYILGGLLMLAAPANPTWRDTFNLQAYLIAFVVSGAASSKASNTWLSFIIAHPEIQQDVIAVENHMRAPIIMDLVFAYKRGGKPLLKEVAINYALPELGYATTIVTCIAGARYLYKTTAIDKSWLLRDHAIGATLTPVLLGFFGMTLYTLAT